MRTNLPLFGRRKNLDDPIDRYIEQAPDAWRQLDPVGYPVTGIGQVVCVVDVGMDVFHPMFFHADGGYWAWNDVDRDEAFSDGIDTLPNGTVLRSLNSLVFDFQGGTLYGSGNAGHIAGIDWVYADTNGNGKRDFGAEAGFTDASPSMGEPLFTSDDVLHAWAIPSLTLGVFMTMRCWRWYQRSDSNVFQIPSGPSSQRKSSPKLVG